MCGEAWADVWGFVGGSVRVRGWHERNQSFKGSVSVRRSREHHRELQDILDGAAQDVAQDVAHGTP